MNALISSLRQTRRSVRLIWLIYSMTLVLGLLAALPFYNTLTVEDQNSRAVLNLLNGFDYTVYSDFMHRSERAISPLLSVGRWLGVLYLFLSVFFAGGILLRFAELPDSRLIRRFGIGQFWQGCSQYMGRFLRLFGVTLLFVLAGAGLWLVAGSLIGVALSDTLTERGLFWIGVVFFALFVFTAALILCIGDYAKVLMFREDERNAFRAFGQAGRLVLRNPGQTYGLYWLLLLMGAALFGFYFLLDELITMHNWPTILLMVIVQQALIFGRTGLKVWSLGTAYAVYQTLPKPVPVKQPGSFSVVPPVYTETVAVAPAEDRPEEGPVA